MENNAFPFLDYHNSALAVTNVCTCVCLCVFCLSVCAGDLEWKEGAPM